MRLLSKDDKLCLLYSLAVKLKLFQDTDGHLVVF